MRYLKWTYLISLVTLMTIKSVTAAPEVSFRSALHFSDFIDTIHTMLEHYEPADIYALVDIDYTVTVPAHPALHTPNLRQHHKILTQIIEPISAEDQERIASLVLLLSPQMLIESSAATDLQTIQKKGLKTTAITAILCGRFPPYTESIAEWRFDSLKTLAIDFSPSFPDIHRANLHNIPPYLSTHPQYYKGILCTNGENGGHNKGNVLTDFLKLSDYRPKVVIMIDDRVKNLEDVQYALKLFSPDTHFIGFLYQSGHQFVSRTIDPIEFREFWTNTKSNLDVSGRADDAIK